MRLDYDSKKDIFTIKENEIGLVKVAFNTRVVDRNGNYTWILPASFPDGLVALKDLKRLFPDVKASKLAIQRIRYLKEVPSLIKELTAVNSVDLPLSFTPFAHQWEGIEHMLHFPKLALIYQQGLGKTLVAITALRYKKVIKGPTFGKTLILMPKILIKNWEEEFKKYGGDLRVASLIRTSSSSKLLKDLDNIIEAFARNELDVLLTNFEMFVNKGDPTIINKLHNIGFNRIIIDEASRLKGHKSKRGVEIKNLANKMDEVYLLSGTISLGSPLDVYMPYMIMHPNLLEQSYYHFMKQYCTFSPYNKHIVLSYKNLHILKGKINEYTIFKDRKECLDLPKRSFLKYYYTPSAEQARWINAIISLDEIPVDDILQDAPPLNVAEPVVKMVKIRQILSGFINISNSINPDKFIHKLKENPKLELLEELIDSLDEKCIIWCSLRQEIEDVKELLKRKDISFVTSDEANSYLTFEKTPDIKVYLGQVSAGIGTTMNSAKVTIYYSNSLKLEEREQSMDRNYRIGQTDAVIVYDLIGADTLDEAILALLSKKVSVLEFIQSNKKCYFCEKQDYCDARSIRLFSRGCMYYDKQVNVCKIQRVKLKKIKDKS